MPQFVYNGPPQLVVALGLEVKDGDTVDGPDELQFTAGFSIVEKPRKTSGGDS